MEEPPLVVDLDGTLLRSDLLMESGLAYLRDHPHQFFMPLVWLARGKSVLKHELAHATDVDVTVLPYDAGVVDLIETERIHGRRIVLATASHRKLAERVAEHLGFFDHVIATDAQRNLSAETKRDALVQLYGEKGFDYAGNSQDDIPVWTAARKAYVVSASASVESRARASSNVVSAMPAETASFRDWSRALRFHQWLKNLLIFVPLLAAHLYGNWSAVGSAVIAFFCFGLCASSVYLLNDLLDLRDDRHHARKRSRPFASGKLTIKAGLAMVPILLIAAFGLAAWQLPLMATVGLAAYYVLTLAYSMVLKRRMVIDVIALAALYTLRIVVGAMALSIPLSFWLLAFSMFMFLSLALVKRYAELYQVRLKGTQEKARGRGYFPEDLHMIASLGAASGYMAVLVLALFINESYTLQLYRHPKYIWFACPLLLTWISRVWMLAHRGMMNEDPVIFAVRDRVSLSISGLVAVAFWAAL